MRPPNVVFDTNVFISGILFGGNTRRCVELAREGRVKIYTSRALLVELGTKLQQKFDHSKAEADDVIEGIVAYACLVESDRKEKRIIKDESDNRVLEAAEAARADYIITGDKKHILPLRKHKGAAILTAAEFLRRHG